MLEFGGEAASQTVMDGSQMTFAEDVIQASEETPVIAYFRADWCGPCKSFGPELEKAVRSAGGKVKLVKIDVDANQQLAQQLNVRSIPTVYIFADGQPVDAFAGAKTASELDALVKDLAQRAGKNGVEEAIESAESLLAEGAVVQAAQAFASILSQVPDSAPAYSGLVRTHVAMGELDRAEGILRTVPNSVAGAKEIDTARSSVELARQAEKAGPVNKLQDRVAAFPDDHEARFELATALHAAGNAEAAIDHLLELFRRDRDWNDDAARQQLFRIFDSLKPEDPLALRGRRRLSSLIFS